MKKKLKYVNTSNTLNTGPFKISEAKKSNTEYVKYVKYVFFPFCHTTRHIYFKHSRVIQHIFIRHLLRSLRSKRLKKRGRVSSESSSLSRCQPNCLLRLGMSPKIPLLIYYKLQDRKQHIKDF